MKQKLTSLRLRILLPVIIMTLFVVILLTTMFSQGYTDMLIRQAQKRGYFVISAHGDHPLRRDFRTAFYAQ